tara:strand:+ start:8491 stop:9450 length:960 start_codon:yes stop_codon:yes gene_type:complete
MELSVCVIIPCYKDSETLEKAIQSVINQTVPVDEIIVVNDFSPETKAIDSIISSYPSIIYIKNNFNVGLAKSRNIGVNKSSTELISFLDADDELHPQKIELQLSVYKPSHAITCSFGRKNNFSSNKFYKSLKIKYHESKKKILVRNTLNGAGILVSKKELLLVGGYDENLRSCEDWDLWIRFIDDGLKIIKIQLPLYLYNENPHSLSNNQYNISYYETKCIEKHTVDSNESYLFNQFLWFIVILKQIYRSTILIKKIDTNSNQKTKDKKLDNLICENMNTRIKFIILKLTLKIIFILKDFRSFYYSLRLIKISSSKILN